MRPAILCLACLAFVLISCIPTAVKTPSPTPMSYMVAPSPSAAQPAATATLVPPDSTITIGGPTGAVIAPLLGVNTGPAPAGTNPNNADLTNAYRQVGVNLIRTHDFYGPLDMAVMYPDRTRDPTDPRSFDFRTSDAMWKAITGGGFEPYFRLGDSWNNAAPPANARERANWVRAAVEIIRHYRQGQWGGFVTPFRYVEIWNEPDNRQFWPQPRALNEYFLLYVEAALALKRAFPDLLIGGPGMTQTGVFTPKGQKLVHDFLVYIRENNAPLDFFSWHLYSNNPDDWLDAARFYRGELDALGFRETAMHVTEWNTDIRQIDDSSAEAVALRAGGKGAAILTAAWIAMQDSGIAASAFYRGPDPDPNVQTFYGMFRADGTPKRIALAFSLWKEVAAHPQRLETSSVPEVGLWLLAGQGEDGEIALLIANPADKVLRYAITGVDSCACTILQVSDGSEQVQSVLANGNVIEIAGEAVQMVTIKLQSAGWSGGRNICEVPSSPHPPLGVPPASFGVRNPIPSVRGGLDVVG